jgi:propionyl-CoA carboxylase alpha chain
VIGKTHVPLRIAGEMDEPFSVTFGTNGEAAARTVSVVSDWWPGQPVWRGSIAGEPCAVQVRPILNGVELSLAGIVTEARVYTEREAAMLALMPEKKAGDSSKALRCPMPGLVRAIHVGEGDEVQPGQPLCTVEAMKMENILRAERQATVKAIRAKEGDSLAVDAVIMEFA